VLRCAAEAAARIRNTITNETQEAVKPLCCYGPYQTPTVLKAGIDMRMRKAGIKTSPSTSKTNVEGIAAMSQDKQIEITAAVSGIMAIRCRAATFSIKRPI